MRSWFPHEHTETAWLGVIKWQQSSTCISSSISGTLAQEDAEGGTRGMLQKSISPLTLKGNIWHVPTALDVFSVSLQSLDMQKYPSAFIWSEKKPCAHGLRRRWSDIPVMRMEKPKQNHRPWSTRAIRMITARVSHQISHTRKTRVMKKRRTKGERETEREGGGEESARACVCVCAFTSVDRSKCTVLMWCNSHTESHDREY